MDIDQISNIARLTLTDTEREAFKKDAEDVLEAFSVLNTWKMKSFDIPKQTSDTLREDTAEQGMSQEEALENVQHEEEGFLVGPQTTQ